MATTVPPLEVASVPACDHCNVFGEVLTAPREKLPSKELSLTPLTWTCPPATKPATLSTVAVTTPEEREIELTLAVGNTGGLSAWLGSTLAGYVS